uniref:Uncharacterized protein n=1 Tax=Tetraselmis chuii TaxID=63592 RepID=A0A7S1SRZ7_9CHLO|mmetsp:Transcript_2487/g.4450  ORF Transcript_2487/g.4450 Transcript_2487/m.4450 type:complete len:231 (+) Transcript_2487:96-788(+)
MARGLSLKGLVQVASAGKAAISLAGALLPEDPTWTIAIVGAGLTVGYFFVRSKEVNAVERQETIQDIVLSSAGHFYPRDKLADFVRFFLDHPYSGKSLLVAGPKDSGTTLLVCNLLDKCTTPLDHTYGLRECHERHVLRTSSRVAIRARCFVGVAGLVSNLKHNFVSTKLEAVISFIQSLFGAFQGGSISMEEMRELRDREHMDFDDPALLHELKTCAKVCMSRAQPLRF